MPVTTPDPGLDIPGKGFFEVRIAACFKGLARFGLEAVVAAIVPSIP
ncbi:hypothetical protein BQ8794_220033 [Mesorhizobium prunaredense]|uniref:Uncharacterized protein n=1 Tax=Mesorhizobium prunaredense TaxID=1631249 RepID=A0A1R3V894_9HYPH|nr:hypothetical protein BQ8794_220033 [Mesorhizobium prunaredense]